MLVYGQLRASSKISNNRRIPNSLNCFQTQKNTCSTWKQVLADYLFRIAILFKWQTKFVA